MSSRCPYSVAVPSLVLSIFTGIPCAEWWWQGHTDEAPPHSREFWNLGNTIRRKRIMKPWWSNGREKIFYPPSSKCIICATQIAGKLLLSERHWRNGETHVNHNKHPFWTAQCLLMPLFQVLPWNPLKNIPIYRGLWDHFWMEPAGTNSALFMTF